MAAPTSRHFCLPAAVGRLVAALAGLFVVASLVCAAPVAGASEADRAAEAPATLVASDAPDYDDPSSWAYWADAADPQRLDAAPGAGAAAGEDADADNAAAAEKPAGAVKPADAAKPAGATGDAAAKPADVFIVCPTVSSGEDGRLTMDIADEDDRASFVGALNMELGIYSEHCEVFAPYYRQATLAAYGEQGDALTEATALAYTDVRAAFERYLDANPDGPLVLAGFSQGADLAIRLVKDYFGDEGLRERLVAVYAIGWRLTEQECAEYPWLRAAQGERDTGVVVTFNSEAEGVADSLMVPTGTATLAINPLSWATDDEFAPATLNRGACFTDYSGTIVEEIPALCGAYLDPVRGTLKVVGVTPEEYPAGLPIFEDGVYHLYDYQFFYRNLQENVGARLDAYLAARGK